MMLPLPVDVFTLFLHFSVFVAFGSLAIIAHELGHYVALKNYGIKPKITFSNGELVITGFSKLTDGEKLQVYLAGVIPGFIVLLPAFYLLFPAFSVGLLIAYAVGCKHDFMEMARL